MADARRRGLDYVRYEDIGSENVFAGQKLIGVKAPSGTKLEVPDPERTNTPGMPRRYVLAQFVEV